MVFWIGKNSGCSLGSGRPGRGWQGYSSLDVLEGTGLIFFQNCVAFISYVVLVCKPYRNKIIKMRGIGGYPGVKDFSLNGKA